nr:SGNH/GDSL hydrolase family protein [Massilia sp. PDC64]
MRLQSLVLAGLVLAGQAGAAEAPIRVILVGDSTMASKSGYGDALCARFTADVTCVNLARGGRSTSSFRAEGRWDEVQRMLKDGASFKATYVLVQFGHNDQPGKPGRSTDLVTQFPVNMARYAQETRDLGGVPCSSPRSRGARSRARTWPTTSRRGPRPPAARPRRNMPCCWT